MAKKKDCAIGIIIIILIILGFVVKLIQENPGLSAFIALVGIVGVVAAFYNKNKEKKYSPAVSFQSEGGHDYHDQEYDSGYTAPTISRYWNDIDYAVPVGSNLNIEYTNAAGENTNRDIDISHYDGSSNLRGFCHLRKMPRTFRIDRIKNCIDRETGEIVSDIPTYLRQKYESSPEYVLEKFYNDEKDTLRSLYYIGKADGQLRKPEREIIHSICKKILKDQELSDDSIDRMINNIDLPSLHAFKLAVGRLANEKPDRLALVSEYASKIVNTQKTTHPNEQEALDYIKKKYQPDA